MPQAAVVTDYSDAIVINQEAGLSADFLKKTTSAFDQLDRGWELLTAEQVVESRNRRITDLGKDKVHILTKIKELAALVALRTRFAVLKANPVSRLWQARWGHRKALQLAREPLSNAERQGNESRVWRSTVPPGLQNVVCFHLYCPLQNVA